MNDKVTISANDARKLYWDVLASNVLFIAVSIAFMVMFPFYLWVQVIFGVIMAFSIVTHIFQVKKLLIKGKLFRLPKKVKKNDGGKRS